VCIYDTTVVSINHKLHKSVEYLINIRSNLQHITINLQSTKKYKNDHELNLKNTRIVSTMYYQLLQITVTFTQKDNTLLLDTEILHHQSHYLADVVTFHSNLHRILFEDFPSQHKMQHGTVWAV